MRFKLRLFPALRAVPAILILCVVAVSVAALAASGEFDLLARKKGVRALEVVEKPTLYRVAVMETLPCSAREFEFLLDRPRVSMVLARSLDPGLDEYEIEVKPDGTCHVDDRGRLVGDMELIERAPGRRMYYISGHWRFVWGISFQGRMVLLPEYREVPAQSGVAVNARARGYMKIDSALIGYMARVIAYVFPGKVDARIKRFSSAVRKVAEAVRADPSRMYAVLVEHGGVPPDELAGYRAVFMAGRDGGKQ